MENVVIVTGGSRGIGAATVTALSRRAVIVFGFVQADAEAERLKNLVDKAGGRAIPVRADLARSEGVEALFAAADKLPGCLVGLVNNAGINGGPKAFVDCTASEATLIFQINTLAAIEAARRAVLRMSTRHGGKGGAIVNVSSQAGSFGGTRLTVYAASKAALNALTIGLAREVAPDGIRVNAVSPGVIATEMNLALDSVHKLNASLPMGRSGQPEEVAKTIEWLLLDAPAYLCGAVIPVAGAR